MSFKDIHHINYKALYLFWVNEHLLSLWNTCLWEFWDPWPEPYYAIVLLLRCSFFCFMESYWTWPWNLLVNFIFFSQILFSSSFLLWSIFFWNHPKDTRGFVFNCLLCSCFLSARRVSLWWQAFLRPGASWLPFSYPRMGDRRSVTTHRLCWWEVFQDARGRVSQHTMLLEV